MNGLSESQMEVCHRFGAALDEAGPDLKIGVARNVREGLEPVNGLRHKPENGTAGWFIYAGEAFSEAPDFFEPLHVRHLEEWRPGLTKYLGLPPGWRFLVAENYEDVWFDQSLLELN